MIDSEPWTCAGCGAPMIGRRAPDDRCCSCIRLALITEPAAPGPAAAGPFHTERQARAAAHQAVAPEPGLSILRVPGNRELLTGALTAAGVELGAYDERIVSWLAGWEDSICAVIAGWITRAATLPPALGLTPRARRMLLAALADTAARLEQRATVPCDDCLAHPADLCDRHGDDLDTARRYRDLADRIGEPA